MPTQSLIRLSYDLKNLFKSFFFTIFGQLGGNQRSMNKCARTSLLRSQAKRWAVQEKEWSRNINLRYKWHNKVPSSLIKSFGLRGPRKFSQVVLAWQLPQRHRRRWGSLLWACCRSRLQCDAQRCWCFMENKVRLKNSFTFLYELT